MRYRTIVADPPWRYRTTTPRARTAHRAVAAEHHYATMTNNEIAALPVKAQADADAHLYLWVTVPRLFGERKRGEIAPIDILEAWGFRYVTMLTWHKTGTLGMGFYFRGETEHVLFGVRGNLPIPTTVRERNHFSAPKNRHSAKPDCFYDMVERVSPEPRLELFGRRARLSGWDYWGDESLETVELG
jgi:N6-adenosine-specific RNA methylase IME4